MTVKQLDSVVTNTSGIEAITISDSHTAPVSVATITATSTTLGLGDIVNIDLGYTGDTPRLFHGYVKNIESKEQPKEYIITASNVMVRALDYFLASDSPDNPYKKKHIKAENLVGDLMAKAGLTNFVGDNSYFTFGINSEVEVNLTSIYDYCKFIADIIAWHLYADVNGQVHFLDRRPFPMVGEVATANIYDVDIMTIDYSISDKDLRNRVVVYGAEGVNATAQASSPYLPAGFYKAVVVAAASVFERQSDAQAAADYNLVLLNRLTENLSISIIGNTGINCRKVITVHKDDIGASGDWYVFSCEHNWSKAGYKTNVELRR